MREPPTAFCPTAPPCEGGTSFFAVNLQMPPMPKGRPRYTRSGRPYTPKRTREWEQLAAKLLYQSSLGFQSSPDSGPIGVALTFIHKRPKRLCRKSDPDGRLWRPIKGRGGDLDNQIKSILDACQAGRLIEDDAQVVELWARDLWGAKDEEGHIMLHLYSMYDPVNPE